MDGWEDRPVTRKSGWAGLAWVLLLFLGTCAARERRFLQGGPWYPAYPGELKSTVDRLLAAAPEALPPGRVVALVAPHAGFVHSGRCAAAAFSSLRDRRDVTRVILLGPSHLHSFSGARLSGFDRFTTPLGPIEVDTVAEARLARQSGYAIDGRVHEGEHSLENHLPFLQRVLAGVPFRIVPILLGRVAPEDYPVLAGALLPLLDGHTVIAVSTDLTHHGAAFGFTPFPDRVAQRVEALDRGFLEAASRGEFSSLRRYVERTGITACGAVPVGLLLHLLPPGAVGTVRAHDLGGDESRVVGYGAIVFTVPAPPAGSAATGGLTPSQGRQLISLARRAIAARLSPTPTPSSVPSSLPAGHGSFVTLRRGADLRGCVGTLVASGPLAEEVADNAVKAALADPRFPPVTAAELPDLTIEVSVLTPLRRIASPDEVHLGADGILIRLAGRQAVFLPQVARETGWDLTEFWRQLCLKAGLPQSAPRDPAAGLYVFQAQVFVEGR